MPTLIELISELLANSPIAIPEDIKEQNETKFSATKSAAFDKLVKSYGERVNQCIERTKELESRRYSPESDLTPEERIYVAKITTAVGELLKGLGNYLSPGSNQPREPLSMPGQKPLYRSEERQIPHTPGEQGELRQGNGHINLDVKLTYSGPPS